MGQLSRADLKAFFETGDKPTESQFGDLIDSMVNYVDDGNPYATKFLDLANDSTSGVVPEILGSTYVIPANLLDTNGMMLRVTATGAIITNTNDKYIGIRVDGNDDQATIDDNTGAEDYYTMVVYIIRTGAATSHVVSTIYDGVSGATPGDGIISSGNSTPALTWSTALDLNILAETPGSAGDISLLNWSVELIG